jgi:hypothetical protein
MSESKRPQEADAAEKRFERTVRNLLHTPPKPHKAGEGKTADKRGSLREVSGRSKTRKD